jgi:hypothetical protein
MGEPVLEPLAVCDGAKASSCNSTDSAVAVVLRPNPDLMHLVPKSITAFSIQESNRIFGICTIHVRLDLLRRSWVALQETEV